MSGRWPKRLPRVEQAFTYSRTGHGLAAYTSTWFDDLCHLDKVDWSMVCQPILDTTTRMTWIARRKKQAEFLVYRFCDWSLVQAVIVIDDRRKTQVEQVFASFPQPNAPPNPRQTRLVLFT